ncbi:MAG: acetoacetate decarboxylase family protein, partial [Atribacterota bacterium]|nr:acetoacetate decarboxylase family protein [Atribacterota bacterium]
MKGKFQFQDGFVYKMPAHFGGYQFYPVRVKYNDITNIVIQYETKPEVLLQYIPEEFDLLKPLVNVQYSNCRDVDWMAGGEYRLIQVTAPVKYTGSSEGLTGEYALVVWENKTCPIIGGREEDGVPKIFADIANERYLNDHWFTTASYESNTFLKMDFYKKAELAKTDIEKLNEN